MRAFRTLVAIIAAVAASTILAMAQFATPVNTPPQSLLYVPDTWQATQNMASGTLWTWNSDTGISRDSAGVLDFGNGTQGDKSGTLLSQYLGLASPSGGAASPSAAAPVDVHTLTNQASAITITNTSTGTAGSSDFFMNNSAHLVAFGLTSTGYTPAGMLTSDQMFIENVNAAGGITILNANATPMTFGVNGAEVARFASSGTTLDFITGGIVGWGASGTADTGLSRDSAGVVDVGTGAAANAAGSLKLRSDIYTGSTSGTLTLKAPAVAGSNTITWPAGTTDFSGTGGASNVVKQTSAGGAFTVAQLACSDLSNSAAGCSNAAANPTATVGTSATNGSATTYMRSDAAPAISQSIAPTWTGAHTWSPSANATPLTESGYSLTGSSALSLLTMSGTINTTGSPDIIKLAITDTARGASTTFLNLYGGASGTTSEFKVGNTGAVTAQGAITFPGVTTGTNADVACFASGNLMTLQAAASCTISSLRFKKDVHDLNSYDASAAIAKMRTIRFRYKGKNVDPNGNTEKFGLVAENMQAIEPHCVVYDPDMKTPKAVNSDCVIALLVKSNQQMMARISKLEAANDNLRKALAK